MKTKNSHYGESRSSRADKMSGTEKPNAQVKQRFERLGLTLKVYKLGSSGKQFFNRKRRMFLKNPIFFDKI